MTNNKLADIVQWDIASWAAYIELWEKRIERDLSGQSALEIGSRKGGLTLWAALRGASCVCSDLESPAGMAGELHRKYGIAHNVVYESIDACHIPYRDTFDFVLRVPEILAAPIPEILAYPSREVRNDGIGATRAG